MKKSILKGSISVLLLCGTVLSSGCVGYVYDGGVGLGGGWGWRGGGGGGWRGGWGGGWRGGWRGGHRGGGWHRGGGFRGGRRHLDVGAPMGDSTSVALTSAQAESNAVETLAADFEIRRESAQKILRFASGRNVLISMRAVGLDLRDYKFLKNRELPSDEVVDRVAATLGEDSVKIKAIFEAFVDDTQADSSQAE